MRKNIWANLQLLDFGAFCEQHSSTTVPVKSAAVVSAKEAPVNAGDDQYFSAISNNHSIAQKSMETVFWFLFHRLSPTEAQEVNH
jgi:hypothetical protein